MENKAVIRRQATDYLGPSRNANEHCFVERIEGSHHLFGLIAGKVETLRAPFAGLHTGRNVKDQNLSITPHFRHHPRLIRVEETTDQEQQENRLGKKQEIGKKAMGAQLVFFDFSPEQQGGNLDTSTPTLAQIDEHENP
jgi:hypothetical protein